MTLGVDLEVALGVALAEVASGDDSVVVAWVVAWEECLEVALVEVVAMAAAVTEQTRSMVSSFHEQGILSTCEVFHSQSQKTTLSR